MIYHHPSLFTPLVDEWRNKWHLGSKWYDSSINDLERDMSDINEHVRLQAIATIAKAATFRPPDEPGSVSISSECFYNKLDNRNLFLYSIQNVPTFSRIVI